MINLSCEYADTFNSEKMLAPAIYDFQSKIMPIMKERSRFKEIVDFIDKFSNHIGNEDFSEAYTNHYFIHCSELNDGLVASIAICNMIYEKYSYDIGEYMVNRSVVNPTAKLKRGKNTEMGLQLVVRDADISSEDIVEFVDDDEEDEDSYDDNPSVFLFHETTVEKIFRFDYEGVKVCFVIYVDNLVNECGIIISPKQVAEKLCYTYLDIPSDSKDDLALFIANKLCNQNMSVSVGNSKAESAWKEMFINASSECSMMYGNQSGNLFCCLTPPDRFSRFSSIEYLKRFVREEIAEDDPETLDMILYTAGLELYEDMPIVEWNEIRERINPSDIIIAIDMSGSCDGDVTANFLRQIYTLFNEMDIRGFVNIHLLFFDTEILGEKIIRTREDAERLVKEYKAWGFGGTDFRCVFSYADNFPQLSGGRQLKGLFFFSDAMGSFPDNKKPYKTTFFVPDSQYSENESYDFVPDWIELIHYNDN